MRPKTKPLNKTRRKCRSRKIRFDTEYEADRSVAHHVNPDKTERPIRSYYCRDCDGFHLTSTPWRDPLVYACCGGSVSERHELSCESVSPEEFFARTGGRGVPEQGGGAA